MPDYKLFTNDENIAAKIKQLRSEESIIVDANRNLVEKLWDIEAKINIDGLADSNKQDLERQKKELLFEITSAAYPEKIQVLRNRIEALEIAIYGFSNINSSSPVEDNGSNI